MSITRALFLNIVFSIIALCIKGEAALASNPPAAPLDVPSVVPSDYSPERYMLVKELTGPDRVVFFYQDHEGYMHYYNGREDMVINREIMDRYKKMGAVPMAMSYGYDGKYIYFSQPVRWGPKKLIFMKLEPDGKVLYTKELSSLEQVLRPASMAFDRKGGMLLTWLDEAPPGMKAVYMVVNGDRFPEKEEVLSFKDEPVLSAMPVYTEKGFAIVYAKTDRKQNGEIRVRFLSDGSEKVLYSGKGISDFDLAEGKDRFLIIPYETSTVVRLFTLNTAFEKVEEYTAEKPKGLKGLSPLADNVGFIGRKPLLLGVAIPPQGVEVDGYTLPQKPNIFYSYAGKGFERLVGGTPFMFSSKTPSFDSSDGHTVVAYTDKRLGSAGVMAAVFDSKGKLIKRDILIERPGVDTGTPRVVHLGGGGFRVFYPVKDKVWIYRARDIKADTVKDIDYHLSSVSDRKELLDKTVERYVDCRKKNDYGCVYDMLDPFYRSGVTKGQHEEMMKRVNATIIDFRIEGCKILQDSILAACDGFIKAKLPPAIKGATIKEGQRDVEQKIKGDIWIFLDGKWYFAVTVPMLGYVYQW